MQKMQKNKNNWYLNKKLYIAFVVEMIL